LRPYPRPEPDYNAKVVRDLSPFEDALAALTDERRAELDLLLTGASIADMQSMFSTGDLTSEELVLYYIDRIQRYDVDGLNSVIALNPQALESARVHDEQRASGSAAGGMHGIPVLLKDNIAVAGLPATAGAVVMQGWTPDRDAGLVTKLRQAGAIILGKANLSEWANFMDSCMPNGFSAVGGQTENPYGPFETYGSSSGSAVAAAANLATVTVGSETQGSLLLPAGVNSVVAIKTTKGLVSGDYIIPLLPFQDVAGPMGRTVTDTAVLLTAMAGVDENDPETQNAAELDGVDFAEFASLEAAQGQRIGVVIITEDDIDGFLQSLGVPAENREALMPAIDDANRVGRAVGQALSEAGMEVIEIPWSAVPATPNANEALPPGFKRAINEFLAGLGDAAPVGSLEEIIAFNEEDTANRMPYGQDHLEEAQASDLTDEEWQALREDHIQSAQQGLRALFDTYGVDAMVENLTQAYAAAGYPAITIPTGYGADGEPTYTHIIGDYLSEPSLITAGYALEQALNVRVDPNLDATMQLIEDMASQ
jgi:amidase